MTTDGQTRCGRVATNQGNRKEIARTSSWGPSRISAWKYCAGRRPEPCDDRLYLSNNDARREIPNLSTLPRGHRAPGLHVSAAGCEVLEPGTEGYALLNTNWNGALQHRPAGCCCLTADDVKSSLLAAARVHGSRFRFAAEDTIGMAAAYAAGLVIWMRRRPQSLVAPRPWTYAPQSPADLLRAGYRWKQGHGGYTPWRRLCALDDVVRIGYRQLDSCGGLVLADGQLVTADGDLKTPQYSCVPKPSPNTNVAGAQQLAFHNAHQVD